MSDLWVRKTLRRHVMREALGIARALAMMAAGGAICTAVYRLARKAWEHWK